MNEQANEKKVGIPEPIKLLLAEFEEIILGELLDGLPPIETFITLILCQELAFQNYHIIK